MEAKNQTGLTAALSIAYQAVMQLGYKHQKLVNENLGVNFNTLNRIRDGKAGKTVTDKFYLRLFVYILNKEYQKRMGRGGDGASTLLLTLNKILLAEIEMPPKLLAEINQL